MRPVITVNSSGPGLAAPVDALSRLTRRRAVVGIPATTAQDRQAAVRKLIGGARSKKRKEHLVKAALSMINNAQLLFIHTNGSPLKSIPARPVLEPAIMDPPTRALIEEELGKAAEAALTYKDPESFLKRAGLIAENAARAWFTNPKNNWVPNKPSTIRAKGSSRPLIDTAEMRKAITSLVLEDKP